MNGVSTANINFASKKANISFDDSVTSIQKLKRVVKEKGFILLKPSENIGNEENRLIQEKRRLVLAWSITFPLTIKMIGEMFFGYFVGGQNIAFILDLVVSYPVIFYCWFSSN